MKHRTAAQPRPVPPVRMMIVSVIACLLVILAFASLRSGLDDNPWTAVAHGNELFAWLLDLVAAMLIVGLLLLAAIGLRYLCIWLVRPLSRPVVVYQNDPALMRARCDLLPCDTCARKLDDVTGPIALLNDLLTHHPTPVPPTQN